MKVSFLQYQTEASKLPVSLYLGSGVAINLIDDKHQGEAFFDPFSKEITLNYHPMAHHFDNMVDIDEVEKYIRADLYHEVSHVFMTPDNFYYNHKDTPYEENKVRSSMNIFEDERMETILSTFYYGVNFQESNIIMNDYKGTDATCAREDFYFTVRFRHGKKTFLNRVEKIIKETPRDVYNANTNGYYDGESYKDAIITLMEDIYRDWYENNAKDKLLAKDPNYDSLTIDAKNDIVANLDEEEGGGEGGDGKPIKIYIGETEFDPDTMPMNGDPKDGEGEGPTIIIVKPSKDGTSDAIKNKEEWVESYQSHVDPNKQRKEVQKMLETKMNKYKNSELTKAIDEIFAEFAQKTKNTASAAQRYSGKFNPREVGRQDWRVWTYKDERGPVKGYDKLHMNLFIDTSGSFRHNEDRVNTLLRSLIDLEEKYNFFWFDLVTCQVGETLRSKKERYIQCGGGNDLDDKVHEIYKQLQDPMSFNVNIALFDGDAFTDARGHHHQKNFAVFNSSHNSIISDTDNKNYIEQYSPNSHNIMVPRSSSSKYPDLLFENIIKSINVALK